MSKRVAIFEQLVVNDEVDCISQLREAAAKPIPDPSASCVESDLTIKLSPVLVVLVYPSFGLLVVILNILWHFEGQSKLLCHERNYISLCLHYLSTIL